MLNRLFPLVLLLVTPLGASGQELDGLLRALARQGDDIALVSYTVGDDGGIDPSDPVLMHNADQPMLLASTIKIVILAAYAREVVAGRLDPAEPVTLGEWDRHHLPFLNNGKHVSSLEDLGFSTDPFGFASDPAAVVPLDALVWAMIRHSDNAAPDLLLERLGRETIMATIAELGMTVQEPPLSFVGSVLSWVSPEYPELTNERLRSLLALGPEGYAAEVDRLAARYRDDPSWRAEILDALASGQVDLNQPNVRKLIEARAPKGSVREYARLMAGVVSDSLVSPEFVAVMRSHLEWLMNLPGIPDVFARFGTKGGSLPMGGVLTSANYFIPLFLDFEGKARVSVLFLRDLDEDLSRQLLQEIEILPSLSIPILQSLANLLGTSLDFLELIQEILCISEETTLCLNHGRFRVQVGWRDFQGQAGTARVVPFRSDDSGLFSFFAPDNWEMLVKVLDGCAINDRFWVFSAATTTVEYTLLVTDTGTGAVKEYVNPLGNAAAAITDTSAFATCQNN